MQSRPCTQNEETSKSYESTHVTRRTAWAVTAGRLLKQYCSQGSCLDAGTSLSGRFGRLTSGGFLQYTACKWSNSLRAASRASGSLSFNCAAAICSIDSSPICSMPSIPWHHVNRSVKNNVYNCTVQWQIQCSVRSTLLTISIWYTIVTFYKAHWEPKAKCTEIISFLIRNRCRVISNTGENVPASILNCKNTQMPWPALLG